MERRTDDGRAGREPAGLSGMPVVHVLAALLAIVLLAGTASAHAAGSAHPDDWKRLVWVVLAMAAGVATVVFSWMALALWRYREGSPYMRKEPKVHDTRLESIWTTVPVILVVVIVVLSLMVMQGTEELPEDAIRVKVIGRQFEWIFVYPDNTSAKNELWIEEGQKVVFEITAEDVVHSFFLPDFYLKVDAFPRYEDEAYLIAEPAGDYDIYCAEYCGDIHSEMLGSFHVFPKGLSDKPYGPPPGEVPPPPEVLEVTMDVELSEVGGGNGTSLAVRPALIELPEDAHVSLRVWNNGTVEHGLALDPPYLLSTGAIPPGEFRWLNFTTEFPTAGIDAFCPLEDHRAQGMRASLVVEEGRSEEPTYDVAEGDTPWAGVLATLSIAVAGVTVVAALRPRRSSDAGGGEDAGQGKGGSKGSEDGQGKVGGDGA